MGVAVVEFLIRRTDGEWFDLHRNDLARVFLREDTADHKIEGPGDFRFVRDGVEIEVNCEDPGYHIIVEQPIDSEAIAAWVEVYLSRIESVTAQHGRMVPLRST